MAEEARISSSGGVGGMAGAAASRARGRAAGRTHARAAGSRVGAAAPLQILIPTKADKCVRDEEKSRSRSQSAAPEFSLILTELTEIYCGQMHDRIHSCTEFSTSDHHTVP